MTLANRPPIDRKNQLRGVRSAKRPVSFGIKGKIKTTPTRTPAVRIKTPTAGSMLPRRPTFSKSGANPQQKEAKTAHPNAERVLIRFCASDGGGARANAERRLRLP